MAIKKHGSAQWQGGLKDGRGTISTESGALDEHPYGFAQRFEGVKGSNPEELIGAAHAACFSMALSQILGEAGFTADYIKTSAEVTLDKKGGRFCGHRQPPDIAGQNPRDRREPIQASR